MADDKKPCKWCGIEKPVTAFWVNRRNKSGRDTVCSECRNGKRNNEGGVPVLTKGLKKKANGLYPFYWETWED